MNDRRPKFDIARAAHLGDRAGFTLVELLVTAVLAAFIVVPLVGMFNAQQRSYIAQNDVATMQQSARVGLGMIARAARSAGYQVPDAAAIRVSNSASGPDQVTFTGNFNGVPVLTINDHDTVNDTIDVPSGSGIDATIVGTMLMLYDDDDFHTVRVTTFTPGLLGADDTIGFEDSLSPINYAGGANKDYDGGTMVGVESITYSIATADGRPRLFSDRNLTAGGAVSIVDDIEDLQFAYGLDTNGDDVVDAWSNNPADTTDIRLVRINVVARTGAEDKHWIGARPGVEDHGGAVSADGRRRSVMRVTEKVRNLAL